MYAWLNAALDDTANTVVTANRRLARTLHKAYAENRLAAGNTAWDRPRISAVADWYQQLDANLAADVNRPTRINVQQSRLLWEQSLRIDLDDPLLNIGALARQCRDTWQRMHEWGVSLAECQREANGVDQRVFARAAGRYSEALESRGWVDDAHLPTLLARRLSATPAAAKYRITLAGFDRVTPQLQTLFAALENNGASIVNAEQRRAGRACVFRCEHPDAELMAAGSWARERLAHDPKLELAIVVPDLDKDSERSGRLLREGLTPGWQYATERHYAALNVSYGRRLGDYPAIRVAILALRWLHQPLRGEELSVLLRTPMLGGRDAAGRARLELALRDWPDRPWTRPMLRGALSARDDEADADGDDWFTRWQRVASRLEEAPRRQRPRDWASMLDGLLADLGWPGEAPLNSVDYQLDNRWRDLLNEFARLELVVDAMTIGEATERIAALAGEALFQPESDGAVVSVLGPLEAAGIEFDELWVTGMTAGDWPPAGQPLPLLSRDLQARYRMPDATPADTTDYAVRVLERLRFSADICHFSFPVTIGDSAQLPTSLLDGVDFVDAATPVGWHAHSLLGSRVVEDLPDEVPAVRPDETVSGGAATIQRQAQDPFSAFAYGRLGVRRIDTFSNGIAASLRGNLIHAALHALYRDKPSRRDIAAWDDTIRMQRIDAAVDSAFRRHERLADPVLRQLLLLERQRAVALLDAVVNADIERRAFVVDTVESGIDTEIGGLRLRLRCDRIDRLDDGKLVILDYKSGSPRRFLTRGEPNDLQLVVYACAAEGQVAGLGLYNVDSAGVGIDGAGPALTDPDDWHERLGGWQAIVTNMAQQVAAGDVRINAHQGGRDARPLNVLSRFSELVREQ